MKKNFPYKRLNDFIKEECNTSITRDTMLRMNLPEENEGFGFYVNNTCYHVEKINNNKYNIGNIKRMKVTFSSDNIMYNYDLKVLNQKPLNFKQLKQFIKGLL